eukprot:2563785-Alexandrium_andersonii.AAC.1
MDRAFHDEGLVGGNDVVRWIDVNRPAFHGTIFEGSVPLTHTYDFAATQQATGSWFLCKGDRDEALVGREFSWAAIRDSTSDSVL